MDRLAFVPALLLCVAPGVLAQPPGAHDEGLPAPALRYRSAFADYRPWQDIKPGNWRQLNDDLAQGSQAGSHAGHALAAPPATVVGKPVPSADPIPHGGGRHQHGDRP